MSVIGSTVNRSVSVVLTEKPRSMRPDRVSRAARSDRKSAPDATAKMSHDDLKVSVTAGAGGVELVLLGLLEMDQRAASSPGASRSAVDTAAIADRRRRRPAWMAAGLPALMADHKFVERSDRGGYPR
jgi:hypothetical protein